MSQTSATPIAWIHPQTTAIWESRLAQATKQGNIFKLARLIPLLALAIAGLSPLILAVIEHTRGVPPVAHPTLYALCLALGLVGLVTLRLFLARESAWTSETNDLTPCAAPPVQVNLWNQVPEANAFLCAIVGEVPLLRGDARHIASLVATHRAPTPAAAVVAHQHA